MLWHEEFTYEGNEYILNYRKFTKNLVIELEDSIDSWFLFKLS